MQQDEERGNRSLTLHPLKKEGVISWSAKGHLKRSLADASASIGLEGRYRISSQAVPVAIDLFSRCKPFGRYNNRITDSACDSTQLHRRIGSVLQDTH